MLNMFCVLVAILAVFSTCAYGGHYPSLSLTLQSSNYQPAYANAFVPQAEVYNDFNINDQSLSYSLLYRDYNYLKEHKNGQQAHDSFDTTSTTVPNRPRCNKHYLNYNNYDTSAGSTINDMSYNYITQANTNDIVTSNIKLPIVEPLVKKHIYFHVPPPNVEEGHVPVAQTFQPPKKTYNILFIKVPSQDIRYTSNLQALLRNNYASEEKTLIYVLAKKPDEQPPVILQEPVKTSEHEVFYVKYKGDTEKVATEVNDSLGHVYGNSGETTVLHPTQ